MQPLYDLEAVRPMWEELTNIGFRALKTSTEVDEALKDSEGTTLVVVNSVCGCAAGHARPGVGLALQHEVIPDNLTTVFAGVDREATQRARQYMIGMPASSPSVALFDRGELVYMLHRSQIEMLDARGVAALLIRAFEAYCSAPGPSVSKQVFESSFSPARCSSTIPRFRS